MNKIWLWSLLGFGALAGAGIAVLLVLSYSKVDIVYITKHFPYEFRFGAASASYQIEGAWNASGKSPSIWDTWTQSRPDGPNGNDAADSYNLYKEDVKALKEAGFHFYKFSISWSRILPDGAKTNDAGVDYYNKLIDELIANKIEPMVSMYYWDLPQHIQDLGGWTNELVIEHFKHYSDVLFEKFGDRVKKWITFDEPFDFCHLGYGLGFFAPGISSPGVGEYLCGHHVLLAHAEAYENYKNNYREKQQGEVGIALNSFFFYPKSESDLPLVNKSLHHMLGWFANPIFGAEGNYPVTMIGSVKNNSNEELEWSRLPEFTAQEVELIKGSADFLGLSYFTSRQVSKREAFAEDYGWHDDAGVDLSIDPSWPKSNADWLVSVPEGLHDLLVWIKNQYNNPKVLITQNGYADGGELNDEKRIEFLREHLKSVSHAIKDGCNVAAYTVWSLIDGFDWVGGPDWSGGYESRFGLFYVNVTSESKERVAKKSSEYFSEVIQTRRYTNDTEEDGHGKEEE